MKLEFECVSMMNKHTIPHPYGFKKGFPGKRRVYTKLILFPFVHHMYIRDDGCIIRLHVIDRIIKISDFCFVQWM